MEYMPGGNLKEFVAQNRWYSTAGKQEATAQIQYLDNDGVCVHDRLIFGRGLNEEVAKRLFRSIVHGMKYLHKTVTKKCEFTLLTESYLSQGRSGGFREVNAEHVLLTENRDHAKISDFLFPYHTSQSLSTVRNVNYIPPEVWLLPDDYALIGYDTRVRNCEPSSCKKGTLVCRLVTSGVSASCCST